MATVAVPFKTINRKFATGAEVSEHDDLSPHTFQSLKAAGVIVEASAPPATLAPGKRVWKDIEPPAG